MRSRPRDDVPRDNAGNVGADQGVDSLARPESSSGFRITLSNFEGPFDLLLSLISRRKMDVTEVALSQVTDEFIAYLTAAQAWDLDQATEFLVVASTLLDLKAARLLPAAEVEDDEDLALLEGRDLLFARLLQYRAYKLVAAHLAELERSQSQRHGRVAELEPRYATLMPDVLIGVDAAGFAEIARSVFATRPVPVVTLDHVHAPRVSVHEHLVVIRNRLLRQGSATFRSLVADCGSTLEVVARFLALLELYREDAIGFDQAAALADLRIRWIQRAGDEESTVGIAGDDVGRSVDEEYG